MRLSIFRLLTVLILLVGIVGCSAPKQPPLPVGNLRLGVAFFTQPKSASEMLASYMSEDISPINQEVLTNLDSVFTRTLARNSKNTFVNAQQAEVCWNKTKAQESNLSAVSRWAAVGRCMNVEILVVPQAYEWRERQGSSMGVVVPARIAMDFFVVNVRDDELISRSHFEETQTALSDNLLEAGKFFKRGGRWISGDELAQEAMERAIKDLGL